MKRQEIKGEQLHITYIEVSRQLKLKLVFILFFVFVDAYKTYACHTHARFKTDIFARLGSLYL